MVALGATLMLVGRVGTLGLFTHVAFALMLMGVVVAAIGPQATRAFWFPIAFLAFLAPVGTEIVPILQRITAVGSVEMLRLAGVPAFLDGIYVEMPNALFTIDEACAGIRFLIPNFMIATLYCHLAYARPWKWAAFLALALIAPVAMNTVRAFGIMAIAHFSDNALAVGVDHLVYGFFFFSVVMVALLWIGSLFADHRIADTPVLAPQLSPRLAAFVATRSGAEAATAESRQRDEQRAHGARLGLIAVIAGGPALTLIAALVVPDPSALAARDGRSPSLPPGWSADAPDADWRPVFATADRLDRRAFVSGDARVELVVAWWSHQRQGAEVVHFANRFDDDKAWKRGRLGAVALDTGASGLPTTARRDEISRAVRDTVGTSFKRRMVASWYWVDGAFAATAAEAKWLQIRAGLTGGRPDAAVIAVAADWRERRTEATDAIEALLADLGPAKAWIAPQEDATQNDAALNEMLRDETLLGETLLGDGVAAQHRR